MAERKWDKVYPWVLEVFNNVFEKYFKRLDDSKIINDMKGSRKQRKRFVKKVYKDGFNYAWGNKERIKNQYYNERKSSDEIDEMIL